MTRIMRAGVLYISVGLALCGCAAPLDIGKANRNLTPQHATATFDSVRHQTVAWGGVVVEAKNLADKTQFELLGYPLDDRNRPNTASPPIGRFIALHPGYLETADYTPGRAVTVIGAVTEIRSGTVGEASYQYPILSASRIHLWPKETPASNEPRFHFGIGIGISR